MAERRTAVEFNQHEEERERNVTAEANAMNAVDEGGLFRGYDVEEKLATSQCTIGVTSAQMEYHFAEVSCVGVVKGAQLVQGPMR